MKLRTICSVALALLPGLASADYTTESVPRILPYHGQLELDGFAVTAEVAMRFTLYDDQGAAAWTEEWSDDPATKSCAADACLVPVVEGRFTAWLGRHRAIADTLLEGAPRDLEIAVREDGGAWRALSPRQALTPAPRAMWVLEADDLTVDGALTVKGEARVSGDARASSLVIEQGADVGGAINPGSATIEGAASASSMSASGGLVIGDDLTIEDGRLYFSASARGDGGAAISHDSNNILGIGTVEGQNVDIVGSVTTDYLSVDGTTTFSDGLVFPEWTLKDERYMFYSAYYDMGGTQNYNTGINGDHWMCWIGGIRFTDGDICERSTSNCGNSGTTETEAISSVFAYPNRSSHEWTIHAEFLTHNDDEEAEVLLVCAQVDAVGLMCPDSVGFWRNDCSGQNPFFDLGSTSLLPTSWRW